MGQHVTRPLVGMHSYWVMEKSVHGGESSPLTTPFRGRSDMFCSTRERLMGVLHVETTRRDDYNLQQDQAPCSTAASHVDRRCFVAGTFYNKGNTRSLWFISSRVDRRKVPRDDELLDLTGPLVELVDLGVSGRRRI
jgi:hypothetical protein